MTQTSPRRPRRGKVVDFDSALLAACPAQDRDDVIAEAALLADAFAPEGRAEELRAMAAALGGEDDDRETDRQHARLLAAALRRLANRQAA